MLVEIVLLQLKVMIMIDLSLMMYLVILCIVKYVKWKTTSQQSWKQQVKLLKLAAPFVSASLAHICNLSLNNSRFPDEWKKAKVTPIFKSGDKSNVSNHRHISVLPIISKIIERTVHDQLYAYLCSRNLLSDSQSGFRSNHSTTTTLLEVQDYILNNMDKGFATGVIFLDLKKKAFDTVSHEILINKLASYGIKDDELDWCKSYLCNRSQAVHVNSFLSDLKHAHVVLVDYLLKKATLQLDSGVVTHPRRSRRHPAKSLNDLDFADDIALLESSISRAQGLAQLTKTAEAAADLGLVISAPKTEYMTVNCNPQPALQVYGDPINHVSDFRYLGSMVASGSSDLKRRKSLAWCAFWKLEQL